MQILPINLKVSAGSLVTFTNWFFGWLIAYSFNFLLEWNTAGMLSICCNNNLNRFQYSNRGYREKYMFFLDENFIYFFFFIGTFFIFAVVTAVAVLFVWALVPETKGRTLEEIQSSLSNFLQWKNISISYELWLCSWENNVYRIFSILYT